MPGTFHHSLVAADYRVIGSTRRIILESAANVTPKVIEQLIL